MTLTETTARQPFQLPEPCGDYGDALWQIVLSLAPLDLPEATVAKGDLTAMVQELREVEEEGEALRERASTLFGGPEPNATGITEFAKDAAEVALSAVKYEVAKRRALRSLHRLNRRLGLESPTRIDRT